MNQQFPLVELNHKTFMLSLHKNKSVNLPLGDITPLQKNTNPNNPNSSSRKEDIIKSNKVTQYFEADIQ